jgi:hypothetical protein
MATMLPPPTNTASRLRQDAKPSQTTAPTPLVSQSIPTIDLLLLTFSLILLIAVFTFGIRI